MSQLAIQLIKENIRKYALGEDAPFLDLGNCGLTDKLPKELFDCVWLEGLNFGQYYYDFENKNYVESQNKQAANKLQSSAITSPQVFDKLWYLCINNNQISDLAPLASLAALKSLDISYNRISDLSPLTYLVALSSLDISNNQISDLSPLASLTALHSLSINYNEIHNLSPLTYLVALSSLDISSNQISDLLPLSSLVALKSLDISSNQISDLSPLVALMALNSLDISENQISDVSPLATLLALNSLVIYNNKIIDVSPLTALASLNLLDINENQISNVSPLAALKVLNSLDISSNEISDVSPLTALVSLKSLNISANEISDISPLTALIALNLLDIGDNEIIDVSPLATLVALNSLDISGNEIEDLENLKKLTELPELKNVGLKGNPVFAKLPPEVAEAGWEAIKYRLLNEASFKGFNEVKVLLLGNTNVGKSNLLQYLETGKKPNITITTHGIQYKPLKNIFKNTTLHCWDFGGQEYFHATHKLFFSQGALHIVMWSKEDIQRDSTNEIFFSLPYWFRCIEQLTPFDKDKIEVIVAENKININDYQAGLVNQIASAEKFKNLRLCFTNFNLQPLKRVSAFKELLEERAAFLTSNQDHPATYRYYLDQINDSKKNVLFISEIDKDSPDTASTAMRVFHRMGVLLYFDEIIKDKVFIKPQALLRLLYKEILGEKKIPEISRDAIKLAIKGNDLGLTIEEVIDLLNYFNLVFQIQEEADLYFIPQYLKPAPSLIDYLLKHQFQAANIRMESDNYLISSAMAAIFSEYGQHVKGKANKEYLFWKDGIIIEKDGVLLMIKFNRAGQYIELFPDVQFKNFGLQYEVIRFVLSNASDERSKAFVRLRKFREMFKEDKMRPGEEIEWKNDKFTVWISLDGKFFSSWNKLIENSDKGILQIEAVRQIRDEEKNTVRKETKYLSIYDYNRYLPKKDRGQMKKVFISYSKKDLSLVNHFIDHLVALRLDGKVSHWYCTELIAGSEWNNEIQEHFDNSDIVCFMVSPNFMRTPYIHEYEIKKAFVRKEKDAKFKIVPIILDFCKWTTKNNNLGQYTALPYTAKPVMDFRNQNMAWYIIQECLRLMIDQDLSVTDEGFYKNPSLPQDVLGIFERIIGGRADV